MADTFENPGLEQEIASIERELASKRELLRDQNKELPPERETLHEVVRQKISSTPPPVTPAPTDDAGTTLPPELHKKAQALVNVAFLKTIDEAIKEARATNNAALIDAFHDLLVDELYTHLVERGKLKTM